jgi:Ni,Fe-hydrogenase I large subunit
MPNRVILRLPLNRAEGDLEVRLEVKGGQVIDAWSSGTMYRGFERMLIGRGLLDGLVITPRVCGICSTAHLTAASRALDMIFRALVPSNAVRVRNICLMAELIQSDMRQSFLMFAPDLANPAFGDHPLYEEACRRYQPLRGRTAVEVLGETRRILEIISILGGQWPHSSYMVPGGVTSLPNATDLMQCRHLLKHCQGWYERRILGCSIERWRQVKSLADLDAWLEESEAHREGELGFFVRFAREAGLGRLGRGHDNFLSYGAFDLPQGTSVKPLGAGDRLLPAGFARGSEVEVFDQAKVAEHVAYSWYKGNSEGLHPFDEETIPYASGREGKKYTWAKAPRYDGLPAEAGPLAEMIVAGQGLFTELVAQGGASVLGRVLARLVRATVLIPAMETWLAEVDPNEVFYLAPQDVGDGEGSGLTEVSRGALGHWVRIKNGHIDLYQIITPTAWNGSPRDGAGLRGPWEEALIGLEVPKPDNPVNVGLVVRSFDPCLVCTVHCLDGRSGGGPGSPTARREGASGGRR